MPPKRTKAPVPKKELDEDFIKHIMNLRAEIADEAQQFSGKQADALTADYNALKEALHKEITRMLTPAMLSMKLTDFVESLGREDENGENKRIKDEPQDVEHAAPEPTPAPQSAPEPAATRQAGARRTVKKEVMSPVPQPDAPGGSKQANLPETVKRPGPVRAPMKTMNLETPGGARIACPKFITPRVGEVPGTVYRKPHRDEVTFSLNGSPIVANDLSFELDNSPEVPLLRKLLNDTNTVHSPQTQQLVGTMKELLRRKMANGGDGVAEAVAHGDVPMEHDDDID